MKHLLIILALTLSATSAQAIGRPVNCEQIKQLVWLAGSVPAAEQLALANGYTPRQIAYIKRRCLKHA